MTNQKLSRNSSRHPGPPAVHGLFATLTLVGAAAVAQSPAAGVGAPVSGAGVPGPARAASAAAPATENQRVEITGGRESDTEQRRRATASKIVIGREEIDKFGDATVGEVLRRLPGVTTPGAPGRGGPPRMRGLGGGFTQLLIDGQRMPPGFSLESLTPEQVERIEILRAPTAETGARAIAGTINIVTREGFRRRLNDVRVNASYENGQFTPGLNWTHNDSAGDLTYNVSGSLFRPRRESDTETRTTVVDLANAALLEDRTARSTSLERRFGTNLTSRFQWRLGDGGDSVSLNPSIFHSEAHADSRFTLDQARPRPCTKGQVERCTPELYSFGNGTTDSRYTNARLNGQWRQRWAGVRWELNGGGGGWRAVNDGVRNEFNPAPSPTTPPRFPRVLTDSSRQREDSLTLNLKGSLLAGGNAAGAGEHSIVGGTEIDASRRTDTRSSLIGSRDLLADFGDNLQARSLRLAAYAQDEWSLTPAIGLHAGLRWEGITTRGDSGLGADGLRQRPTNRSSVWTPLLHAVFKRDEKSRDQIRVSLTRSYRSPPLGSLIARPSINRDYDPDIESNTPTTPDGAGNPNLLPELATGIDIAAERYLDAGGVLSANLFHRRISNLLRSVTSLETVAYSDFQRYVRRSQNIGDATTSGLELEAKFRLDQPWPGALPIELRSNLAVYTSKVDSVPGPDNRLDEQARVTANVGADYRMRSMPLTLGGNVNQVPGFTTRTEAERTTAVTTKAVWDAYALWTFSPATGLRLLGSNLAPRDYATTLATDSRGERTTVRTGTGNDVNWQLRLELKL